MRSGTVRCIKAGPLRPALTVRRPSLTVPVARPLVLIHCSGKKEDCRAVRLWGAKGPEGPGEGRSDKGVV